MAKFDEANKLLEELIATEKHPKEVSSDEPLFVGVDLGTAFIVLVVIDAEGTPVALRYQFADVVRDGMVVNYIGACDIVSALKAELEEALGRELEYAAAAVPPGTESLDGGVVKNVCEAAGFECVDVLDEASAANRLLNMQNGAVVDIGGGTTGIAVLQEGRVVDVADEATGGTHFTLVVAGALQKSFADAESYKRESEHHAEVLRLVSPTIDKVSSIVGRAISRFNIEDVVVVGGTAELTDLEKRMEARLNISTTKPNHPMFVTPFGIALAAKDAVLAQDSEEVA